MVIRAALCLLALAGCDRLFGLQPVRTGVSDAATADTTSIDALPCNPAPPIDYPIAKNPYSVTLADLDGVKGLDIIAPGYGDKKVAILLNNGDGTFTRVPDLDVGTMPTRAVAIDGTGDGILDLVVTNYGSNVVTTHVGLGDGTFDPNYAGLTSVTNPIAVAKIALDGSVADDLVVAVKGQNVIQPYYRNMSGLGGWSEGTPIPTIQTPQDVAVADLDMDGHPDLVVSGQSVNQVGIQLGASNGTFSSVTPFDVGVGPGTLAVGLLNGDALPDIAVATAGGQRVDVLYGSGGGSFGTHLTLGDDGQIWSVALGHLDGDATLDLAYTEWTGSMVTRSRFGTATAGFSGGITYATHGMGEGIAIGNLDGHPPDDIVVVNWDTSTATVFLGCMP